MSDYLPQGSRSLTKKMHPYLPPEVITLILRRLPVESAVRCTAVCKSWYALIKHPSFISTHLQQAASSLEDDDLLLLCFLDNSMRYVYHLHRDNDAFEEYKQLIIPIERFRDPSIVGACNGLICLSRVEDDAWNIFLWNPSIHKHFILPEPDLPAARVVYFFHTLVFGFDSVSNDYKVLLILADGETDDFNEVWLFSLNRHSWKRLTEASPIYNFHEAGNKVFVNGALHYGMFSSHMISAFDLSTEKFLEIKTPEPLVPFENRLSLIKYEESIALVNCASFDINQLELWVMKEYGVDSSWTKVLHLVDEIKDLNFVKDVIGVFDVREKGKLFLSVSREHEHEHLEHEHEHHELEDHEYELMLEYEHEHEHEHEYEHMYVHEHYFEVAILDLNCHEQEHKKKKQIKRLGVPNSLHYSYFGSYVESLVLLEKGEEDIAADSV